MFENFFEIGTGTGFAARESDVDDAERRRLVEDAPPIVAGERFSMGGEVDTDLVFVESVARRIDIADETTVDTAGSAMDISASTGGVASGVAKVSEGNGGFLGPRLQAVNNPK